MRDNIIKIGLLITIILLSGCTGQTNKQATGGILIKNELNTKIIQPGGSVRLRTSVNNMFDNDLVDTKARLVRSFGQLGVSGVGKLGTVQANPNATARTEWVLNVKEAQNGTTFTNKVRLCFTYNQTAWHEIGLVNSFDIKSKIKSGSETGPLKITFSGLDQPFVYNEQIHNQIPLSIDISNNYNGHIGTINLSRDEIPNITRVDVRIFDSGGGPERECYSHHENGSPFGECIKTGTNLEIMRDFDMPICGNKQEDGCFHCDNSLWNDNGYFDCYATNLSVFGKNTFLGTRLNITQLNTEELIETIEVNLNYDYCIESDEFTLTVYSPGRI